MLLLLSKTQVSNKLMYNIIMKKGKWKEYVCRYAKRFQCECDFVICQDCCNKNNNTRSTQNNTANAQRLHDMINPLLNRRTDEAQCVENCIEYHKLQHLEISDSAHIWIPSWRNKKQKQLQNKKRSRWRNYFPQWMPQKLFQKIWNWGN